MKKFLPTLILLLVLGAGYMYARSENFFREEVQPDPSMFEVEAADIEELWFGRGENRIEFVRTGEQEWEMAYPAEYPLRMSAVNNYVRAFTAVRSADVVTEAPSDLAEFGLDEETAYTIEATLADGSSRTMMVGISLPIAGTSYVKTAESDTVFAVSDSYLEGLFKSEMDFLDTVVIQFAFDEVNRVDIRWNDESWLLTKDGPEQRAYDSAWTLQDQEIGQDKEIEPHLGAGILNLLNLLLTDRLPRTVDQVEWDNPEFVVEITENDGTVHIHRGQIDNQIVRIAKEDGQWAFAIGSRDIQAIADQLNNLLADDDDQSGTE